MGHHRHHYSLKNFLHDAGTVTKPLHKDLQGIAHAVNQDFNKVVDTQSGIANNLIKTGGSTLSSLSLPLAIGGVAILAFMLMKNK